MNIFMGKGIVEGPENLEDQVIRQEGFYNRNFPYLKGYLDSYENNRGFLRRFLEDRLGIQEPIKIRAARKALHIAYPERHE